MLHHHELFGWQSSALEGLTHCSGRTKNHISLFELPKLSLHL